MIKLSKLLTCLCANVYDVIHPAFDSFNVRITWSTLLNQLEITSWFKHLSSFINATVTLLIN